MLLLERLLVEEEERLLRKQKKPPPEGESLKLQQEKVQEEKLQDLEEELPEEEAAVEIPSWIKMNAEFWVNGKTSDDEFATALEWLINHGIIRV